MPADVVLFAGASGLIGGLALTALLQRAEREDWQVVAPTRRPLGLKHRRLHSVVADLNVSDGLAAIENALNRQGARVTSFACAIGSTLRVAGSQAAFAAVDRDLVLALAGIARCHGARQAIVVSSVGASAGSANFYLRVKGEMEAGIEALGFECCDFLQPGLLLGERAGQPRPGERIGQLLAPLYNPLLRGPMSRYRAIPAGAVAAALVALVGQTGNGVSRHAYAQIETAAAAEH
jgi:uncharacterized protein YbjT (DUF2867 family)